MVSECTGVIKLRYRMRHSLLYKMYCLFFFPLTKLCSEMLFLYIKYLKLAYIQSTFHCVIFRYFSLSWYTNIIMCFLNKTILYLGGKTNGSNKICRIMLITLLYNLFVIITHLHIHLYIITHNSPHISHYLH